MSQPSGDSAATKIRSSGSPTIENSTTDTMVTMETSVRSRPDRLRGGRAAVPAGPAGTVVSVRRVALIRGLLAVAGGARWSRLRLGRDLGVELRRDLLLALTGGRRVV